MIGLRVFIDVSEKPNRPLTYSQKQQIFEDLFTRIIKNLIVA